MSDEKNPSNTDIDSSEDIFEYYKNLNDDDKNAADSAQTESETNPDSSTAENTEDISNYEIISDPDKFDDSELESDMDFAPVKASRSVKLSVLYIIAVVMLAAAALFIVYASGNSGLKPKELIESSYNEQLAQSTEYKEACERYDAIREEIDDITKERDEKQAVYDAMQGYAEKASDINAQIDAMRADLAKLEAEVSEKTKTLAELEASISAKASSIVSLTSGIYTVGEHIVAGKYLASGSGSILISNSKGTSKVNKVIAADGLEVTLDDGDTVKIESRVKFTPVN